MRQQLEHIKSMIKPVLISAAYSMGMEGSFRLFRRLFRKNSLLILMYHRVTPDAEPYLDMGISPELFEKQIQYLTKHYRIISLDELDEKQPPSNPSKPPVLLTFDDGYKDNFTYAFPILKKYQASALIFVITGFTDTHIVPWYDRLHAYLTLARKPFSPINVNAAELPKDLKSLIVRYFQADQKEAVLSALIEKCRFYTEGARDRYLNELEDCLMCPDLPAKQLMLNRDEIGYMAKHGILFAPHTHTHALLAELSREEAKKEIEKSMNFLSAVTHTKAPAFAYPYGKKRHYTRETIDILKELGIKFAFTAEFGIESFPFKNPYDIKRKGAPRTPYIYF